ncbi:MAG: hypothetical protein ACJ789_01205 [Thermomicrobiales bacterium]
MDKQHFDDLARAIAGKGMQRTSRRALLRARHRRRGGTRDLGRVGISCQRRAPGRDSGRHACSAPASAVTAERHLHRR